MIVKLVEKNSAYEGISLSRLGFEKKGIVEAIVSTFDGKKNPHAAPMGVRTEDMTTIILMVYKTSQTYRNLINKKMGVVNITSNPSIFHQTLFKDLNKDNKLPEKWFHKASKVDAPYMINTEASIEIRIINIDEINGKVKMLCKIENILLNESKITQAYSRANSAVIESLIHASRIEIYLSTGKNVEVKKLIELINHYDEIVNKVARDSNHANIMKDIQLRIKKWNKQS